jgi:hypothetical protein
VLLPDLLVDLPILSANRDVVLNESRFSVFSAAARISLGEIGP